MSRLTQTDDNGNWSVKGLPWKDTYSGQVITKNTEEKIYGALCKLKDYEESGLDPEQVQELKERDTAKKCLDIKGEKLKFATCPICSKRISDVEGGRFCQNCGHRLDWRD